jgi:hypothetical protein
MKQYQADSLSGSERKVPVDQIDSNISTFVSLAIEHTCTYLKIILVDETSKTSDSTQAFINYELQH